MFNAIKPFISCISSKLKLKDIASSLFSPPVQSISLVYLLLLPFFLLSHINPSLERNGFNILNESISGEHVREGGTFWGWDLDWEFVWMWRRLPTQFKFALKTDLPLVLSTYFVHIQMGGVTSINPSVGCTYKPANLALMVWNFFLRRDSLFFFFFSFTVYHWSILVSRKIYSS